MIRWYKLIKWIKRQRKNGFLSFKVITSEDEFIIWNPENNEEFRVKLAKALGKDIKLNIIETL